MLQLPDYWSALLSSDQIVRTLEDPTHPLDLDHELREILDNRLSTAVSLSVSYELPGPAPKGAEDRLAEPRSALAVVVPPWNVES